MRPVFRRLTGEERWPVVHLLRAWGYPRELVAGELEASVWYRFGDGVLVWMHHDGALAYGSLLVHLCVAPAARLERLAARRFLVGLEALATVNDADELVVLAPVAAEVAGYLERLAWRVNARGWYKPLLVGGADGKLEPAAQAEAGGRQDGGGGGGA